MFEKQKFVKVSLTFNYIVPANREDMIEGAKGAILEDLSVACKETYDSIVDGIRIEPVKANWEDVATWMIEDYLEEKNG